MFPLLKSKPKLTLYFEPLLPNIHYIFISILTHVILGRIGMIPNSLCMWAYLLLGDTQWLPRLFFMPHMCQIRIQVGHILSH